MSVGWSEAGKAEVRRANGQASRMEWDEGEGGDKRGTRLDSWSAGETGGEKRGTRVG